MIAPGIDLSHTPGIYYAIAYWLGCTFFIWHNPKKLTGWKLGAAHVLFFVSIAAFMVATDGVTRELFLPCVAFYVFLMLMFIKVCCEVNWAKAGYFCARAFIVGEFAASLEWQMLYFGLTEMRLPMTLAVDLIFLIGIHSLVFLVMYLMERKYTESYDTLRIGIAVFHIGCTHSWNRIISEVLSSTVTCRVNAIPCGADPVMQIGCKYAILDHISLFSSYSFVVIIS